MNKLPLIAIVLITLFSFKIAENEFNLSEGILIKNARVISPKDQSLSKEVNIVIEKDKIIYIGSNPPDISGEFNIIDARGKYIIPGLIDSHVHVTSTDGLLDEEELENPDIVKSYRTQLPKSYL
ncbi:hypothetical protein [Xanthovirga aplysinae]|uniref:hypothetical protein n=1 Tax=Xanthovirga aplysinae TaxID=2529853 RepID=UPI0012BBBDFC|nr:hypothetical protein [Xanthovirga aplysinae]MTI29692.1 hypothetical protein [Xanthovirga aplysinae]